jgi:hypothetical protein
VLAAARRVLVFAEEAQDEGDGRADRGAAGFGVHVPAGSAVLEGGEDVEGLAGGRARCKDADGRLAAKGFELGGAEVPFGELGAALFGEPLGEVGGRRRVGRRVAFEPRGELGGLEVWKGEQEVGQVPFDVDHDHRDARAKGFFDGDHEQTGLARPCHP